MIDIGPYRFSTQDARATLRHAIEMLDLVPEAGRRALAERRQGIADLLSGVDPLALPEAALADILAPVWELLCGAPDDLVAAGATAPFQAGAVVGLHTSDGGVPKLPVRTVDVDVAGVVGDRQATRRHHGRPWQALCLWSAEVIEQLSSDGHPVQPGGAGENVLVAGLNWHDLTLGSLVHVGTVTCHVMAYTVPCNKLASLFTDGDFNRISHERGSLSRLYARVVTPGQIAVGDQVTVSAG